MPSRRDLGQCGGLLGVLRVDAVTICGTDLHILKGDVPEVSDGRILGHEAVGTVERSEAA